jgi:hypothetical protein
MARIVLDKAFPKSCCALGALHQLNLGKGTNVTDDAFHHFKCIICTAWALIIEVRLSRTKTDQTALE